MKKITTTILLLFFFVAAMMAQENYNVSTVDVESIQLNQDVPTDVVNGIFDNDEAVTLSVYPNPFTEFAEFSLSGIYTIESVYMYDMLGNKVMNVNKIFSSDYKFIPENIKSGIYIYSVIDEKGNAYTGRITFK